MWHLQKQPSVPGAAVCNSSAVASSDCLSLMLLSPNYLMHMECSSPRKTRCAGKTIIFSRIIVNFFENIDELNCFRRDNKKMIVLRRIRQAIGRQMFKYVYLPGILIVATSGLLFEQKV